MALISLNNLERFFNNLKTYISNALSSKANLSHTHTTADISNLAENWNVTGTNLDISFAGSSNNNGQLSIQINGTDITTFTANQITNSTFNLNFNSFGYNLIPTTDNAIDVGSSTKNIKMLYTKGITINGTQFLPNDYVTLNDAQTIPGNKTFSGLTKTTGKLPYSYLGNDLNNAIYNMETAFWGPDTANRPSTSVCGTLLSLNCEGNVHTSNGIGWMAQLGIGTDLRLYLRTKTNTYGSWENWKEFITINEAVPRSGGAVMTGYDLGRNVDNHEFRLHGGTAYNNGASVVLYGKNSQYGYGRMFLHPSNGTNEHALNLEPNGTLSWSGQPIQYGSDARLKQQITEIDNTLLDAWEDVDLVQFKYNDAVEEKGNTARLHTGYVVQQIAEACQNHDVDVSKYGLYCHEEYKEETREVENDDSTKTVEVVRPASEHYSLRYTEALIVECAYLRKCIKELKEEIKELKNKD